MRERERKKKNGNAERKRKQMEKRERIEKGNVFFGLILRFARGSKREEKGDGCTTGTIARCFAVGVEIEAFAVVVYPAGS